MKHISILFLVVLLTGCKSGQPQTIATPNDVDVSSDSLYEFKNYRGFLFADSSYSKHFMDSLQIKKVLGYYYEYHGANFVAKQNKVGRFLPVIIYSSGDDHSEFIMSLLDENGNTVDNISIAGGWFDEPHAAIGDSIGMASGNGANCKIIDDKNIDYFLNTWIFKCYVDTNDIFNVGDDIGVDSLHYRIKIEETGKFTKTLIDSVRIPPKKV